MAYFATPLRLDYVDGRAWIVAEPLVFVRNRSAYLSSLRSTQSTTACGFPYLEIDDPSVAIIVPKKFRCDMASIPRFFWRILPPVGAGGEHGDYGPAAVIHDYSYQTQRMSRKEADALFLEAMTVLDISAWRKWSMWLGVRAFGWAAWRNHRRKK